eukprot:bmy_17111T0
MPMTLEGKAFHKAPFNILSTGGREAVVPRCRSAFRPPPALTLDGRGQSGELRQAVEPEKKAMERRPQRRSRSGTRLVPVSRPAEPRGVKLWLFPIASGLRSALSRRTEATRLMCCMRNSGGIGERWGRRRGPPAASGERWSREAEEKPIAWPYPLLETFTHGEKYYCGQLGLGHTNNKDSPSHIEVPDNQKFQFLACGGSHAALLTKGGLLFTFGDGKYGQLGHNSTQKGQLGNGGTHNQLIPCPMKLPSNEELKFESRTSEKTSCDDDYNWDSLVVPFAEAVYKMSDQSSEVLEEYWASLCKTAIVSQLNYWTGSTENNYHIKSFLEMLKKLHRKILDQMPSLEDLKELSPVLGKSLPTLLADEDDDFGEELTEFK